MNFKGNIKYLLFYGANQNYALQIPTGILPLQVFPGKLKSSNSIGRKEVI